MAINAELIDQWGLVHARARFKGLPEESLRIPRPGATDVPGPGAQKDEVITDPKAIAAFFG